MPEYTLAQNDLAQLKEQYAQEADRAEKEFNTKYEEFLNDLKSLTPTIRRKRQEELQYTVKSGRLTYPKSKQNLFLSENWLKLYLMTVLYLL